MANHWGHPTLAGSAQAATIDDWAATLIDAIDTMAKFSTGTLAGRPTAATAKAGMYYLATDTGVAYLSDGTNWIDMSRGVVPIGAMLEWPGTGEPTDTRFLLADGRSLLRASYPDLFAALGGASSPWGLPDGTHFNLPDFRGRTSVSPDNMGTAQGAASRMTTNNTLAAAGGFESVTLTTGQIPAHSHTINDPGHVHSLKGDLSANTGGGTFVHDYYSGSFQSNTGVVIQATTGITVNNNTGGGGSHSNLQPYAVASKIIRVL